MSLVYWVLLVVLSSLPKVCEQLIQFGDILLLLFGLFIFQFSNLVSVWHGYVMLESVWVI